MRILVAGWFSFEGMGTTAGDLLSRDVVSSWLAEVGISYDVAALPAFGDGPDWREADPCAYTHVLFVCGPCGNGPPLTEFLERFRHCRLIGLNLSMLGPLEQWNPFDVLFERDSTRMVRPDLSLMHRSTPRAVAGLILCSPQREYGQRDYHALANRALIQVLDAHFVVPIPIDTCLESNAGGLTNSAQVEALIARMDFVATTRLHGLVLALKNGIPALAIDPVAGGAKVRHQAEILEWPAMIGADQLSEKRLASLCAYCMTVEARSKAQNCGRLAIKRLQELPDAFLAAL